MKRDFNQVIKNFDGVAFTDGPPKIRRDGQGNPIFKDSEPEIITPAPSLTLRSLTLAAIGTSLDGDQHTPEAKMELYALASRVVDACRKNQPVELTTGELEKLRLRIGKAVTNALIAGAALTLLDTDYIEPTEGQPS